MNASEFTEVLYEQFDVSLGVTGKSITFTVYGDCQPAGSKRAFPFRKKNGQLGVAVSDDNAKAKPWQATIAAQAREAYAGELIDGPIRLTLTFCRPRPQGHFGKRGLKESAPKYPTTRPDALKLARAVEDALTGVLWRDDSQIVTELLMKRYDEPARVIVTVETL